MPRDRLRSNVQVRAAGIDASLILLIVGMAISAVVLLSLLGTKGDSRRTRRDFENPQPRAAADL